MTFQFTRRHARRIMAASVLCLLTVLAAGCYTSHEVWQRSELRSLDTTRTLTVLTVDQGAFTFSRWHATDSSIIGRGHMHTGLAVVRDADTVLPFSRISHVAVQGYSWGFYVFGTVAVITTATMIAVAMDRSPGLSIGAKSSSCPQVYAWNGREDVLEGEAFGVALGRALELTTVTTLPDASVVDGVVHVRIANERPETDYVNNVALLAVETDAGAEIAADAADNFRIVRAPVAPVSARDHSGRDARAQLSAKDGTRWTSDLATTRRGGTYEDTVEVAFVRPAGSREARLVLTARSTEISSVMFDQVYAFLGEDAIRFVDATERDTAMIADLRAWLARASMHVSVRTSSRWVECGRVTPEATAVDVTRLVPFTSGDDTVHVRLTALADVWMLDAVRCDWGPSPVLATRRIPLTSARLVQRTVQAGVRDVRDARGDVAASDAAYEVLMPGESLECAFKLPAAAAGRRMHCAVEVGGYLYEWMRVDAGATARAMAKMVPGGPTLADVHTLFRNPALSLPMIYAEWRTRRR